MIHERRVFMALASLLLAGCGDSGGDEAGALGSELHLLLFPWVVLIGGEFFSE